MSTLVGKFVPGDESMVVEFLRDLAEDAELIEAPGGLLRVRGGRGWRVWTDSSGSLCVTEHSPEECDDVAAAVAQDAAELRATEEQLREQSRQARELVPAVKVRP